MTINMPNLSSAGGSWIMRFAELAENPAPGLLSAPVVTSKSDPGYPAEFIRKRIEGTVTLYAIIHRDGSVSEVRVLRGIDDRLDENARAALTRWHFRPATKNGEPVELEAVIFIPFEVRKTPF
jgi:protein TonB